MSQNPLINSAVQIIGSDDSDDFKIQPCHFADNHEHCAPQLSALLRHDALIQTARRYERDDTRAQQMRSQFMRLSNQTTWAIFAATVSAACVTYFSSSAEGATEGLHPIPLILGIISLIGGAWAAMTLHRVSGGRILQKWMQARAAAETDRLGYFNRMVRLVIRDHSDNPALQLLCLEFFRRYQLSIQQKYYEVRSAQHHNAYIKTISIGSIAAFILALGSGVIAILGAFETEILQFAAIGIIGTALATVASRREELGQDERNAERYQRTAELLSRIRERHPEVQKAVAQGNSAVFEKYVTAIHEQLSLEHRQWLTDTEEMDDAIKSLNASLAEIK